MAEKLANVDAEMHRLQIKILGLSEVRWPEAGKLKAEHGTVYYSGGDDFNHRCGVVMLISSEIETSVFILWRPSNDRLKTSHLVMNVVQAYAPTSDKADEEVEVFYTIKVIREAK